jgi:hypothetical protein
MLQWREWELIRDVYKVGLRAFPKRVEVFRGYVQ